MIELNKYQLKKVEYSRKDVEKAIRLLNPNLSQNIFHNQSVRDLMIIVRSTILSFRINQVLSEYVSLSNEFDAEIILLSFMTDFELSSVKFKEG